MILGQFFKFHFIFLETIFLQFPSILIENFSFFSSSLLFSIIHINISKIQDCAVLFSGPERVSAAEVDFFLAFPFLCRTRVIETVQTSSLLLESSQSSGIFGYFSPNNYITFFFYCNCNECTAVLTANAKNNTIYEFSLPITQISSSSHMRSLLNYLTVFRFVVWAQASIINHFVLKYHIFV